MCVVSDVQQPTPDDTQFAKRTSKNRRVECQTQDEKCSATDKQSDGWSTDCRRRTSSAALRLRKKSESIVNGESNQYLKIEMYRNNDSKI